MAARRRVVPALAVLALVAGVALPGCTSERETARDLTIFVAASLTDVADELARAFEEARPGVRVRVHPAASSLLARQIEQGAPADVYVSANVAWTDYLVERGRVAGPVHAPISNRLVLVARSGPMDVADLGRMDRASMLALADPESVPAGIYAREALTCLGLWEQVAPDVVPALDVRAALHAVEQGAAAYAVVYATDVATMADPLPATPLPDRCQPRIRYTLVRLAGSPLPIDAEAFVRFAIAAERQPLWERFGFIVCRPDGDERPGSC